MQMDAVNVSVLVLHIISFITTTNTFLQPEKLDKAFKLHPFAYLDAPELIRFRGYPSEIHRVVTLDGFVLELHRIPHGHRHNNANFTVGRPPVLILHGNFQSSIDWVLNEREDNCLPFLLANAGYDVWLGNFRGNVYSSKHMRYKKTDPKYWRWSAHEIAVYDLTAMIDYILWKTDHRQLHYIGFSLGTTAFFMLLAHAPEYNRKIRLGVSLGTAVFQHHSRMLKRSCAFIPFLEAADQLAGSFPIPSPNIATIVRKTVPHVCNAKTFSTVADICWLLWSISWGFDGGQVSKSRISLLLSKIPNASSSRTAIHICQAVNRCAFTYYDYGVGSKGNGKRYGAPTSPVYNLSAVTAPVSLFSAPKDPLATFEDIILLAKHLPRVVDIYVVPHSRFNHIDFIFAKHARELAYNHILDTMERF